MTPRLEKKRREQGCLYSTGIFFSGFQANFLSAAFVAGEFSGGFENVSAPISCYFIWEIRDYRSLGLLKKVGLLIEFVFLPQLSEDFFIYQP